MVIKRRRPKPLLIILLIVLAVILFTMAGIWIYLSGPTNKNSDADIEVVIPTGTSTKEIAGILKEKDLIKNELFFQVYLKLNKVDSLKASTYLFKKNMNLEEITTMLAKGSTYNPDIVKITFKEGERFTDFCREIANNTNHTYEDIVLKVNDHTYLMTLINKYWFLSDAILQEGIYYPLEGYLGPNTYHFDNKDVKIESIIETMLDETSKNLETYKEKIQSDVHYYITMASMVELEGTNTENRKMITGIFENRLNQGMNLGSDVTTYYALQHPMNSDLTTQQFATINPYNTRSTAMMGKMPIGPICNPSTSSLEAAINPTTSTYLYFVADKNGQIYYTSTLAEHNAKVTEIKEKGDWIW